MLLSKKGAMFGFCRVLRKQFGELFLTSRQSEAPQGANDSIKTKRGAMFGLDARIALAIFGALSVISGAALYSAIQESRVIAAVAEFSEAQKALEAYYLDTGEMPANYASGTEFFDATYLVEGKSVAGWKGPYLPFEKTTTTTYRLLHPNFYELMYINALDNVSWGEGGDSWASHNCPSGGDNCYAWALIIGSKDLSFVEGIDKKFDGSVDPQNGNFRYYQSSGDYRMALKVIPYK